MISAQDVIERERAEFERMVDGMGLSAKQCEDFRTRMISDIIKFGIPTYWHASLQEWAPWALAVERIRAGEDVALVVMDR